MINRVNLRCERGKAAAFAVSLTDGVAMDISADAAVRVEVYRLGALMDEAALVSCTEANGRIFKVTESGTTVAFQFKLEAADTAALAAGDYEWVATDTQNGLATESVGGVLHIA